MIYAAAMAPARVALSLVVVAVLAFLAGRATAPVAPVAPAPTAQAAAPAAAAPAATPSPSPTVEPTVADPGVAIELAAARATIAALQTQLSGEALSWDEGPSEAYQPAAFESNIAAALEACQPSAELVAADCAEPPCMALLRVTSPAWRRELVADCPAWTDVYGTKTTQRAGEIRCGNEVERFAVLSPVDDPWLDSLGKDGRSNRWRRLQHRWAEHEEAWACSGE